MATKKTDRAIKHYKVKPNKKTSRETLNNVKILLEVSQSVVGKQWLESVHVTFKNEQL